MKVVYAYPSGHPRDGEIECVHHDVDGLDDAPDPPRDDVKGMEVSDDAMSNRPDLSELRADPDIPEVARR